MRILHIVAPASVGGLERVVQWLAAGHQRHGHEVAVAVIVGDGPTTPVHPFVQALQGTAVTVFPVPLPARAYRRERAAVAELCRRWRPDVVHTHGYRPDVVDAPVGQQFGVPTVTTVHGFTGGGWRNRLYEQLQRAAFRRFDGVVAVSRVLADRLVREAVPPERVHLIPNAWAATVAPLGPDTARRALAVPEGRFHVGWVGRLGREKGLDVLLDALVELADLRPVVSIIGAGRERRALAGRAAGLRLEARLLWHGERPEAGRLFTAFDVFVLSSRTEGTPIALFEAMAAGVPIVASQVGGVPDVVSPNEALLVPAEHPAALAAALRAVHGDPTAAATRARAARARLERDFALDPWLDRYAALYERVRHGVPVAGR